MLTAKQFEELRQKVQIEVSRRSSCGSLEEYKKDSMVEITSDSIVDARDADDVIHPLLAICDYEDLVLPVPEDVIPESFDESLIVYVNELSAESMDGVSTSCRGACTGLCVGGCGSTCNGCTGSCNGCTGCSASCGTGCNGGAMA